MIELLSVVAVLGLLLLSVLLAMAVLHESYNEWQSERTERLRVERQVLRAEHQLNALANDAFQRMLEIARRADGESEA